MYVNLRTFREKIRNDRKCSKLSPCTSNKFMVIGKVADEPQVTRLVEVKPGFRKASPLDEMLVHRRVIFCHWRDLKNHTTRKRSSCPGHFKFPNVEIWEGEVEGRGRTKTRKATTLIFGMDRSLPATWHLLFSS